VPAPLINKSLVIIIGLASQTLRNLTIYLWECIFKESGIRAVAVLHQVVVGYFIQMPGTNGKKKLCAIRVSPAKAQRDTVAMYVH